METYYWESDKPDPQGMGEFEAESDAKAIEKASKIDKLLCLYKEPDDVSGHYSMIVLIDKE